MSARVLACLTGLGGLLLLAPVCFPSLTYAEQLCLKIQAETARPSIQPVPPGKEIHLSFLHSIYGSEVEEHFRVWRDGLQLFRLRYAEARLAEFYGHDNARFEQGWWVVEREHPVIPTLHLRVSQGSSLSLSLGSDRIPLSKLAIPEGLVRMRVVSCEKGNDGR